MKILQSLYRKYIYQLRLFLKCICSFFYKPYDFLSYKEMDETEINIKMPKISFLFKKEINLSIIVCSYNTEKYIEQCLDSIFTQKSKYSFEVILIDDFSNDKTWNIIQKFKKYENFISVRNGSNHGPGYSRNKALKFARGEFVTFLDSDDVLAKNSIDVLVSSILSSNADVVCGKHLILTPDTCSTTFTCRPEGLKAIKDCNKVKFLRGVFWAKIYKREIFSDFTCLENCWYEDTSLEIFGPLYIKNVAVIKNIVYLYRRRSGSIMDTTKNKHNLKTLDMVHVSTFLVNYFINKKLSIDEVTYRSFINLFLIAIPDRVMYLDLDLQAQAFLHIKSLYFKLYDYYFNEKKQRKKFFEYSCDSVFRNNKFNAWRRK